jgi:general secretion pathway protein N
MKWLWIVGAALLALAVLVQFPAAWLAAQVARVTQERWRLAHPEGTIWRGRGVLYAQDRVSGRSLAGRGVRWRVVWSALLQGRLSAQIDLDDGGKALLSASMPGWSLEQLDASVPAAQMAVLLPTALSDYGWSGSLGARGGPWRCSWSRPVCTGQVEISWKSAATVQIPGPPLGDYRLRLTAEGEALHFDLGTERGRLQIAGAGEFSAGRMRFKGEASATGEDAGRLEAVLRAVGRPGGKPGHYLIDYQERQASR